jgi:hypothetical protein
VGLGMNPKACTGNQNSKEAARRQCETRCTGPQALSLTSGRVDGDESMPMNRGTGKQTDSRTPTGQVV